MIIVEIIRAGTDKVHGTFGILKINKKCFCVTLEPPDRLNAANVSSIPNGQYMCHPYSSPKYGEVYKVLEVSGRKGILFHSGNIVKHTKGCILLGSSFGKLNAGKNRAVLNSGATFKKFREAIGKNKFHLTISESY
jgi:hypothetical protein